MRASVCRRGLLKGLQIALLLSASPRGLCQTPASGAISGKLTDLFSRPLAGVALILRNESTQTTAETSTGKNGSYRLSQLQPGEYVLEAVSPRDGHARMQGIVIVAGYEARVRLALSFDGKPRPPLLQAQTEPNPSANPTASPNSLAHPPGTSLPERSAWIQTPPASDAQPASTLLSPELRSRSGQIATASTRLPQDLHISEGAAPAEMRRDAHLATISASPEIAAANPLPRAFENAHLIAEPSVSKPLIAEDSILPSATTILLREPGRALALAAAAAAQVVLQASALDDPQKRLTASISDRTHKSWETPISGEELQQLPMAGRDWAQIALDANPPAQEKNEHSTQGADESPRTADVTVDGMPAGSVFGVPRQSRSWMAANIPNESAVGEMKSSAPVSFDPSAAGNNAVQIATRHGENPWHGQAFLINRQNLWGANNPFTAWVKESAPGSLLATPAFTSYPYTPSDRQLNWGVGLGSALRRNRLFWFTAFDGNQRDHPAVSMARHPDDFFAQPGNDEMQVLSARLGTASANPVATGLAPYSSTLESLAGLLGPARRNTTQWTAFARLDWNAAERHRITVEANDAQSSATGGGFSQSSVHYGNHSFGNMHATDAWILARWEAFVTSNLLASTQGSWGQNQVQRLPAVPSAFEQQLNVSPWGQLPQMVIDSRDGFTIGNPAQFGPGRYPEEQVYHAQQALDWVHGSFLLKTGIDLRHDAETTSMLRNHTGTYHYARLENFISDASVFSKFGLAEALDPLQQRNCDQRGKAWRDASGQLHGRGYLPCYSYYTQTLGPTDWDLSTSDWAGFATAQWQPFRTLVFSAALRWERQLVPPPIALVNNPDLPLTQKLPAFGNQWGPRVAAAWGTHEGHWPTLSAAYGMYFARTRNAVLETALTRTGSLQSDLNFFVRATDNLMQEAGGAPPFPYVWAGQPANVVKPGAVQLEPRFRNGEVHQAVASVEQNLPAHVSLNASAAISLARHLPITVDTNIDPSPNPGTITYNVVDPSGKGPIKTPQITVPFYASYALLGQSGRSNANYQQVTELFSQANSTYEAFILHLARNARHGPNFRVRYTYAHAKDGNPNESDEISGSSVLDPLDRTTEFGPSDLDIRHTISAMLTWESPWKSRSSAKWIINGWRLSGIGQYHSGLPYTMRTAGTIPKEFAVNGAMIQGLGPSINGFGGDNRLYSVGRNTFRYPATWKADVRISHRFTLGHDRELEALAESFNLFNHRNITQIETTGYWIEAGTQAGGLPTLHFLTGLKSGQTEFGKPLGANGTDYYRPRQFDFGMRLRF